jgi:hypothetical protein
MNVEDLKRKLKRIFLNLSQKKLWNSKKTGKEVSDIQFTAREKMTGLESYDIKITLI